MASEVIRERVGFCTEGGSDKEYRILVIDHGSRFQLMAYNGRRGRATTEAQNRSFPDLAVAIHEADNLQRTKERKHYRFEEVKGTGAPVSVAPDKIDTGLRPQLQTPISEARALELCHDDEFFAQIKYDGIHLLIDNIAPFGPLDGKVRFANKLGFATTAPRKLEEAVKSGTSYTLSGELLQDYYVAYDLLSSGGTKTELLPYELRLDRLERIGKGWLQNAIIVAPTARTTSEKLALKKKAEENRYEGLIFKRRDARFTPGRKHDDQFKWKRYKTASCIVLKTNEKRSVQLGVVACGITVVVGDVAVKTNQLIPEPGSIVEVKYLDYREGGRLTQPELLALRTDATRDECSIDQLEGLVPI
jgi:bifunctional non-homologous end joining protein LigD